MVLTFCHPSLLRALLRYLLLNRQDDVDEIVSLQSKGFFEPWDIDWLDPFFLKLFAVSLAGNTAEHLQNMNLNATGYLSCVWTCTCSMCS